MKREFGFAAAGLRACRNLCYGLARTFYETSIWSGLWKTAVTKIGKTLPLTVFFFDYRLLSQRFLRAGSLGVECFPFKPPVPNQPALHLRRSNQTMVQSKTLTICSCNHRSLPRLFCRIEVEVELTLILTVFGRRKTTVGHTYTNGFMIC
jgi:hypothetical protein